MILVDANLLLYATHRGYSEHAAAHAWLAEQLASHRVGLPWPSLLAYVRIAANPRVFAHPMTVGRAWEVVEGWLALDNVWVPSPTPRHGSVLAPLIRGRGMRSKLVMDAHLAALAIEHGLILCSADRDFGRFPGLRFEDPLDKG